MPFEIGREAARPDPQAADVERGLRMLGTDLSALEALVRSHGASAAFLGGSIAHGNSTPRSDVDLYLLGTAPDPAGRPLPFDGKLKVDLEWIGRSDLAFVTSETQGGSKSDHERLRLLADVEKGFPVTGVQAVADLRDSLDRTRLYRWAIDYLIDLSRTYLNDVQGLLATDLAEHAALPLSSAALAALSAILWGRGRPVHNPRWATALAARKGQTDALVEEAVAIALPQTRPGTEAIDKLSRRVHAMTDELVAWDPGPAIAQSKRTQR